MDISSLSAEQKDALLKQLLGQNVAPRADGVLEKDTTTQSRCCFKPTRRDQQPCTEYRNVSYGDLGFCSKHKRTVQALNAKKLYEESQRPETVVADPTPSDVPTQPASTEAPSSTVDATVSTAVSTTSGGTPKDEVLAEGTQNIPKDVSTDTQSKKTKKVSKADVNKSDAKKSGKTASKPAPAPVVVKRKIGQNKWGRYEDLETGIVFDPKSRSAYGLQNHKTGKVMPLTPKAIKTCQKYSWKYIQVTEEEESSSTEGDGSVHTPSSSELAEGENVEDDEQEEVEDEQEEVEDDEQEDVENEEENDEEDEDDEEENEEEVEDNEEQEDEDEDEEENEDDDDEQEDDEEQEDEDEDVEGDEQEEVENEDVEDDQSDERNVSEEYV